MQKVLVALMAATCLTLISVPISVPTVAQYADVMQFEAVPPLKPRDIFGNAWWIYASGTIDAGAPQRLSELIEEKGIPGESFIFLDSPGGNLLAGMKLGRVIRERKFRSYVGAQGEEDRTPST